MTPPWHLNLIVKYAYGKALDAARAVGTDLNNPVQKIAIELAAESHIFHLTPPDLRPALWDRGQAFMSSHASTMNGNN